MHHACESLAHSLTDDHRLITLINAFIRAREQRTYRALRGRTVQVLRGPTPITAPSLEVRCVLVRGDALWSCDPNPGFFFRSNNEGENSKA